MAELPRRLLGIRARPDDESFRTETFASPTRAEIDAARATR